MSLRNRLVLPFIFSTLAVLVGCGGSSSPTVVAPPSGSFSNSNLNGTYVFSVSGTDNSGNAFAMLGTFSANGSGGNGTGGITGGTIDINDSGFPFASPTIPPVSNSPLGGSSSYTVGLDGRGRATLVTSTPFNTIILDFVLQDSTHGLVTEFDGTASGSGTLDLQTSGLTQSSLAGSYAFSFSGIDSSGGAPFASVGAFTLDQSGNVNPGVEDFNDDGLIPYPDQAMSGQVLLGPSSTPSTLLGTVSFGLTYDVYAIDATHLKFIEMDGLPILSGDAYSQTSATIPNSPTTYAFTLAGLVGGTPSAAGGFMLTDGAGNITNSSTEDINAGGTIPATVNFSATYASAGTGRYTLNNFSGFFGGTEYAAYPSSGGMLMMEIDNAGLMTGAAYTQSSTTFGTDGYAFNLSGINLGAATGSTEEVDDIAEFVAASSGTTVTGIIDENFDPGGVPIPKLALAGTYVAPDANGRGSISATAGSGSNTTLNGGFLLTFYTVDGTTFPYIESDSGQAAAGVFLLQNSGASSKAAKAHMFIPQPLVRPHTARKQQQKQK